MKQRFRNKLFTEAVKDKMFTTMLIDKKRIGLREFAKQVGISAATFSRIENGTQPDLETYFKLCFWMKRSANEFYNPNKQ
jgi:transcriptional regulator with XRE-family HTH domain